MWNCLVFKSHPSILFCSDTHSNSDYAGFVVHEPQPYVPSNPIHENDIERLLSLESESTKGWVKVKKTKEAEIWRRESNENDQPCITKVCILGDGPYMGSENCYVIGREKAGNFLSQ